MQYLSQKYELATYYLKHYLVDKTTFDNKIESEYIVFIKIQLIRYVLMKEARP